MVINSRKLTLIKEAVDALNNVFTLVFFLLLVDRGSGQFFTLFIIGDTKELSVSPGFSANRVSKGWRIGVSKLWRTSGGVCGTLLVMHA